MTEHTPGPWVAKPSFSGGWWWVDTVDGNIQVLMKALLKNDKDEANARFIAAAPDMEKALEKIVLEFEGYASDGLDLAFAALAKARGEMIPESTPGPWRESNTRMLDILQVTDPGCCGERRLDEDGCCVTCGRDFFDPDTGQEIGDGTRVPNARLRDAAFDLLDALDGVVRLTKVQHVLEKWELGSLKTIIAKAKGE